MFLIVGLTYAQVNKGSYNPRYKDPVLEEMDKVRRQKQAAEDSITAAIRQRQQEQQQREKEQERNFKSDLTGVVKPAKLEDFNPLFHFNPVAQYQSGMCWCFAGTSFLESEVYRLTKQKIKLSELHTVYYEYIEKARRFLEERGNSHFAEGSEVNAVFRIMQQYGAVPAEAYTGLINTDKHDHTALINELTNFLQFCQANNYWDVESGLQVIRVILNKHLGAPPAQFIFQNKSYTPVEFLNKVLKLNLADYCDVMSTLAQPFYTRGEFKVPDNWWHDSSYINVPLDEWYALIKQAVKAGYTVAIGGDVGDAGYLGFEDVAFVPDFDIPTAFINQYSREMRIYDGTTGDDHGVHLVGMTKIGDWDWFLIKDSGRSARWGQFEGYYFWRGDFVRLKMLSFTVHKDVLKDILKKIQ
jgi:bleomycin hydrolase